MNKVWNETEIVTMILNNNRAVERAMVAIYHRQTESEKSSDATLQSNGEGFAEPDAKLGSYYARWVISGRNLSGKHLDRARQMAIKYRRQLTEIANSANSGSDKAKSEVAEANP